MSSLSNDEVFPSLYLIDAIVESSKQLNPLKLLQKNYQNPLLWLLRGPVEQEFYIPSFCINLLIKSTLITLKEPVVNQSKATF